MTDEKTKKQIKELREITGRSMMECKKALHYANEDFKEALSYLRGAGNNYMLVTPPRTSPDKALPSWVSLDKIESVKHNDVAPRRVVVWFDDDDSAALFAAGMRVATARAKEEKERS